jgi:hypothetical protein
MDNDNDLDFFITGADHEWKYASIYKRINGDDNTPPNAPTMLFCEKTLSGTLHSIWSGASDLETPTAGLYYNLRVGSSPGGNDVVSGTYGTPLMGNVGQHTGMVLNESSSTFYYCAVQSVDAALSASDWTAEVKSHICGDANGDGEVNVGDAVFLINFAMVPLSPAPVPLCSGDANGDGQVNLGDAVYIIVFVFKGGLPPVEGCCPFENKNLITFKAAPPVLTAGYDGENTIIETESAVDLYGVQLTVECENNAAFTNLVENTHLYFDRSNDDVTIGILDIKGIGHVRTGRVPIVEISGYATAIQALCVDEQGATTEMIIEPTTKVTAKPDIFILRQNYPNPFNPTTEISFRLPDASDVSLDVFNITGQVVTTLVDGNLEAGEHTVVWDGRDAAGSLTASGVYFYRVQAGEYSDVRKMVLLK